MNSDVVRNLTQEIAKIGVVRDSDVVALYTLVIGLEGITILDGTTNAARMKWDLAGLHAVGRWAEEEGKEQWMKSLGAFKRLIGETG